MLMRPKVLVNCAFCNKEFPKYLHHIRENLKLNNRFFCSSKCQSNFKNRQVLLVCENFKCCRKFKRQASQISRHNFCSLRCAVIINNQKYHRRNPLFKRCANFKCQMVFVGERKYCARSCLPAPSSYSREEVLEKIQALAKRLGRTPTRRESPQSDSARKYFGSWNAAVMAAGFLPYRSKSQRMFKRIQTFARDGHYCYSVSELLIDNWLTDSSVGHQKEVLYPEGNFIVDWSIPDKKIFIEYFGLAKDVDGYDSTIEKKKKICKRYGIRLIALYARDLFPSRNLKAKLSICFEPVTQLFSVDNKFPSI